MSRHPLLVTTAVLVSLTVFVTWPQCLHMGTQFAWHNDPHFSIWRLAWIAHILPRDPRHLFDGNIFYPSQRTLAYSDATLLEGIVGAPLFWIGVPPIVIHNLLLLAGFVGSGVAMFVLARALTGSGRGGLVAAAIFTMVPYRIEHFAHLELQWAMWIPLAFWAVHRTVDRVSWRAGALAGIFLWLQLLSCVYYGVFLAVAMTVLALLLLVQRHDKAPIAIACLALGGAIAIVLTLPYARPYFENARLFGGRRIEEIVRYSARPVSYLASPSQNWIWGWTGDRFGDTELRLFPGVIAVSLALVGLTRRPTAVQWTYVVVCVIAVDLSFGLNGRLYAWLYVHVPALGGLRAAARCSIVAFCALGVLAGFGFARLETRLTADGTRRIAIFGTLLLLAVEYGSAPMSLTDVAHKPASLHRMLRALPAGVVVDLPLPRVDRLPGRDAIYEFWSINDWYPRVNGYSGYYPPEYFATIERMRTFPDAMSLSRLTALGVRYIVVHRAFYEREQYLGVIRLMLARPELKLIGSYEDPLDEAVLFELAR